ncbi:beta-propeller domain-containing protein [Ruminococcus flavefaciens]|uniref:Beta propeller domain-containing protein n=1 Tax=Ruminococcus flavefaciens TaxID=1265 RepID=A0A1M7IP60_RUMFL|nr:beta-propeller domain-containing protein [Ruminococcus flavefaciens]SHM42596.1 Beta propeller domain-containing protein [Ruminococcus flavefaciens]
MNNDEKLKEMITKEPIPDSLKPENIKKMLDEQAPKKKRSGIKLAGRITAAAAACAVIGGTAAYTLNNGSTNKFKDEDVVVTEPSTVHDILTNSDLITKKQASYMSGASDYEQVYTMFKKAYNKAKKNDSRIKYKDDIVYEAIADEETVSGDDSLATNGNASYTGDAKGGGDMHIADPETPVLSTPDNGEPTTAPASELTEPSTASTEPDIEPSTATEDPDIEDTTANVEPEETDPEHSDTYNQEQDILEADIVKTDGKHIYYIANPTDFSFSNTYLHVVNAENGKFTGNVTIDLNKDLNINKNDMRLSANDMYIYNDMIVVICSGNNYRSSDCASFAAFYTTDDEPKLIDVYKQSGYYKDVRISPDGYMLLISEHTCFFEENSDDVTKYIPSCGFSEKYETIAPEDILLPDCGFGSTYYLTYSVIGSIDLNKSGEPTPHDIKTLAGCTGALYCSSENLYAANERYDEDDLNTTDITRISIADGNIVPMAGTTIKGYVKDQFSMSEYNGYFRVAATYNEEEKVFNKYSDYDSSFIEGLWDTITGDGEGYYTYQHIKTDTRVYVLDMDMNLVGEVGDLGVNEQLKSASFSGDMAYIVTFRQTDPLYAVDLSNPADPVVLDEFKINGFSTYMQSWGDGLLLGFGQDADENGRITGLRLTMFDNSDPNNLKAADVFTWNNIDDFDYNYEDLDNANRKWYSSSAVWERKSLLIAPEKNLIGIPVSITESHYVNQNRLTQEYDYGSWSYDYTSQYVFFSFEDGKFVEKGTISDHYDIEEDDYYYGEDHEFNRALYIGDYVYALSTHKFVAADINTLEVTDELIF